MKRILFIINPIAGTALKQLNEQAISETFSDSKKFRFTIEYTNYAGHGFEIATNAVSENSVDIVAIVGGDGTVNEIAPALLDTNVCLCIIPAGSGNGLAHHLKIPMKLNHALELIKNGQSINIDVGEINNELFGSQYFLSNCGVGYDAEVIHSYSKVKFRGFLTYFYFLLKSIFTRNKPKFNIKFSTFDYIARPFVFTIANSSQYGYNIEAVPQASIIDGQLDILCIPDSSFVRLMKYGLFSLFRIYKQLPKVANYYKTNRVTLTFNRQTKIQIDGEPFFCNGETVISIKEGALKTLIPK